MYFRYNKTQKYIKRVQDISSYTFKAKKWGKIKQSNKKLKTYLTTMLLKATNK